MAFDPVLGHLGARRTGLTLSPPQSSKSDFLDVSPMEYREKERPGESSPSPSTPWIESTVAQKDRACGALDKASGEWRPRERPSWGPTLKKAVWIRRSGAGSSQGRR